MSVEPPEIKEKLFFFISQTCVFVLFLLLNPKNKQNRCKEYIHTRIVAKSSPYDCVPSSNYLNKQTHRRCRKIFNNIMS